MLVSSEDLSIAIPTRHTLIRSTFKLVLFQGWQHIKMSDRCSGMNRGTMERGGQLPDFDLSWYLMSAVPFPHVSFMCVLQRLWPWPSDLVSDCISSYSEIILAFLTFCGNLWDFFFIMKLIYLHVYRPVDLEQDEMACNKWPKLKLQHCWVCWFSV